MPACERGAREEWNLPVLVAVCMNIDLRGDQFSLNLASSVSYLEIEGFILD